MQNSRRDHVVSCLDIVWESMSGLCESFTEDQWKLATDCPGWSVQDQLSHITGSESRLAGNPTLDHTPPGSPHVKNQIGASNEAHVDYRRSRPGSKVLKEFDEVTAKRREMLKDVTEDDLAVETQNPTGSGTVADAMYIRIFDAWVHEQDIRRAVGTAGHFEGLVAEYSMNRMADVMPYVVGRRASAPDGTAASFQITGLSGLTMSIGVTDGRASRLGSEPDEPTVTLVMESEVFLRLCCGRIDPEEALNAGAVKIAGNLRLGEAIVQQMNYMP